MARRKTGPAPIAPNPGNRQGVLFADPAGRGYVVPTADVIGTLGGGDVHGPAVSTDNAIARWNGTDGKHLQNSTAIVQDDGRISTVTDPTGAQDAATKAYVDAHAGGGGVDYVVMSNGANPPTPMDNGAGAFLYVSYTP